MKSNLNTKRVPVFHVPHDGRAFPVELMESVCIPEVRFRRYHEEMRDTDMTLAVPREYRGGELCRAFPVSRLLCDVERFIGPEESMEKLGMGFCYEKAYDGTVIKRVNQDLKERTLRYYRAHHAELDRVCSRYPGILLFDMHSYSDRIIPAVFPRKQGETPDLCIGTETQYTPPELAEAVRRRFSEAGFTTDFNYPYAGCLIPNAVMSGRSGTDCAAVMLEINKRTYCDREGRSIPEKLERIEGIVRRILEDGAV